MRIGRRLTGAVLGLGLAGLVAGCGSGSVSADDVAEQAKTSLEEQVGQPAESVECEDDLKAEVDESVRCELTAQGQTYGLTATVSSVDGDNVQMEFQVDDQPQ